MGAGAHTRVGNLGAGGGADLSGCWSRGLWGVSVVSGEDGPQCGALVFGQWWGLGNEAFDVRGQVVRVAPLGGNRVVAGVGWAGCRLGVCVLFAGLSTVQGQVGCLLSVGVPDFLSLLWVVDCGVGEVRGKEWAADVPTPVFRGLTGGRVGWSPLPHGLLVLINGGKWGRGRAGEISPAAPLLPRLVPRIVATVPVTLGECLDDVVGADDAVAMRLADLDAVGGEHGFEVGETPALVSGRAQFG
jgi:hypothetical protein